MKPFVPHELPWWPVVRLFPVEPEFESFCLTKAEVLAIKALFAGNANEYQQKMAAGVIVEKICGTHDMTFRPGDDGGRASAFAEGKRHVGLQIDRALKLPIQMSGDQPNAPGTTSTAATADTARAAARKHPKPPAKRRKPGTRDPGSEAAKL